MEQVYQCALHNELLSKGIAHKYVFLQIFLQSPYGISTIKSKCASDFLFINPNSRKEINVKQDCLHRANI